MEKPSVFRREVAKSTGEIIDSSSTRFSYCQGRGRTTMAAKRLKDRKDGKVKVKPSVFRRRGSTSEIRA